MALPSGLGAPEAAAAAADAVLRAAGGEANVAGAASCATRLRLTLVDPALADERALAAVPGCAGVIARGDERHLVVGPAAAVLRDLLRDRLTSPYPSSP